MHDVISYALFATSLGLGLLWRHAEQERVTAGQVLLKRGRKLEKLESELESLRSSDLEKLNVKSEREADLFEKHLEEATRVAELTADVYSLRESLLTSESRRRDVASVIEQVLDEKRVWSQLYQDLRITCANAQSAMWGEITRLTKVSQVSVRPDVKAVVDHADKVLKQQLPTRPTDDDYRAKIAAATAAAEAFMATVSPKAPPPNEAA